MHRFGCSKRRTVTHILKCVQRALGLLAFLLQSQDGVEDGLTWVHGPIKLMVHVPPEPAKA